MLGTRRFLSVYLGSAVAASLSSIAYYSHLEPYLRKMQNKPRSNNVHYSLGASGTPGNHMSIAKENDERQYSNS